MNSDTDRSFIKGINKGLLGVFGDVLIGSKTVSGSFLNIASAISSGVGIVVQKPDLVVNYVLEGLIHQATIASFVAVGGRAIHEFLFGEVNKLSVS